MSQNIVRSNSFVSSNVHSNKHIIIMQYNVQQQ